MRFPVATQLLWNTVLKRNSFGRHDSRMEGQKLRLFVSLKLSEIYFPLSPSDPEKVPEAMAASLIVRHSETESVRGLMLSPLNPCWPQTLLTHWPPAVTSCVSGYSARPRRAQTSGQLLQPQAAAELERGGKPRFSLDTGGRGNRKGGR